MKRNVRRSEAGFSLVTAVIIITLLVFVGTMVLSQVANDVQLAGGDRAAMNALYVAEAGAVWGKDTLTNLVCPNSTGSSCVPVLTSLTTLTKLQASNKNICPEGTDCSGYYALDGYPTPVTYNNGTYVVAATCLPNCSGSPSSFVVRAYGVSGDAARLIELTVGF